MSRPSDRRRAAVIVIDACGAGALPDAAATATRRTPTRSPTWPRTPAACTSRRSSGSGSGRSWRCRASRPPPTPRSTAACTRSARARTRRPATGSSWGSSSTPPLPTYPDGFPPGLVADLEQATGMRFCANRPADGLAIIDELGEQPPGDGRGDPLHVRRLRAAARGARRRGARARAARGVRGGARGDARRARRRPGHRAAVHGDARPLHPHRGAPRLLARAAAPLVPRRAARRGRAVHAVGKIRDLFAGVGIDASTPATTNEEGIAATTALLRDLDAGLIFTNLVETDQVYGHRHDVAGFRGALQRIDAAVGGLARAPARRRPARAHRRPRRRPARAAHRPHARVRAAAGHVRRPGGRRHDGPLADVGASSCAGSTGRDAPALPGASFIGA